jgi:xanthine dehydrogenase accessory factor
MNASNRILMQAHELLREGTPVVMVTVARTRGSSPRAVGAHMLISPAASFGTVGGGQLEHEATRIAESLLRDSAANTSLVRRFTLGADCGQCCGGVVDLAFECITRMQDWLERACANPPQQVTTALRLRNDEAQRQDWSAHSEMAASGSIDAAIRQLTAQPDGALYATLPGSSGRNEHYLLQHFGPPGIRIAVFGAGHVGKAVVELLSTLDVAITWVDNRPHEFPAHIPAKVTAACRLDVAAFAADLAPHTLCLIMTHSHALDFDVCTRLLARDDIPFCGLIGSTSKRLRFERLLRQAGLEQYTSRLTCPIGIGGISGKSPQEVAIAVAAQILQQQTAINANVEEPTLASIPH